MEKLMKNSTSYMTFAECLKELKKRGYKGFKKYYLFLDIIFSCYFVHSNMQEYFFYDFEKLSYKERKKFLLYYDQRNSYRKVNIWRYTKNKMDTYAKLKVFYGRELMSTAECGMAEFVEFAKRNKKIILKPEGGSCGKNTFTFEYKDDDSAIYQFVCLNNIPFVCEGYISQHPEMNKLNNTSVNTVRITTFYDCDKVNFVGATIRIGRSGNCVDNLKHGGIGANIDLETGVVYTSGYDYEGKEFLTHPDSGTQIKGFKIPNWSNVLEIVTKSAEICKECPILGWDIAVTPDSAVLVEANNRPDPMMHQFADKKPKGEEILKFIKKNANRKTKAN